MDGLPSAARAGPPLRRAAPGRRGRGAEIAPAYRAAGPRDRGHLARPAVDRRWLGPGRPGLWWRGQAGDAAARRLSRRTGAGRAAWSARDSGAQPAGHAAQSRSEEHTSELQSLMRISYAVFCLKKKKKQKIHYKE